MISDKTLDEALVELLRTKKALEALRAKRKVKTKHCIRRSCALFAQSEPFERTKCRECNESLYHSRDSEVKEHSAAKRASLDLTRKLAELRR